MRFTALSDHASRYSASVYETEAEFRHQVRQQFIGEEIQKLSRMERVLVNADELMEAV